MFAFNYGLFVSGTVHTDLVHINPYLHYSLYTEIFLLLNVSALHCIYLVPIDHREQRPPTQAALHSNCNSIWQSTKVSGQMQEHYFLSLIITTSVCPICLQDEMNSNTTIQPFGTCSSWCDMYHNCNVLSSVPRSNMTLIIMPFLFSASLLNILSPLFTYFMCWLLMLSCARFHGCPYELLGDLAVQSGVCASHFFFGHWPPFLQFLRSTVPLPLLCAMTSSLNSGTVWKVPCSFLQTLFLVLKHFIIQQMHKYIIRRYN